MYQLLNGVLIKIDGCDLMFRVKCHTSFIGRTGKIETGAIHDPHYFERMRSGGQEIERNPTEIRCSREMNHYFFDRLCRRLNMHVEIPNKKRDLLSFRCRGIIHNMVNFEIEGYENNLDFQISFMMNEFEFELGLGWDYQAGCK